METKDNLDAFNVEMLKKMADSLFEVLQEVKGAVDQSNKHYLIAQCFVQIILMKTKAILKLAEGIKYYSASKTILQDPTSMYVLFRSIYEHYVMFHSLFVQEKEDEAREVLELFWELAGEANKISLKNLSDNFLTERENSRDYIDRLKSDILEKIDKLHAINKVKGILHTRVNSTKFTKCKPIVLKRNSNGEIFEIKIYDWGEYAKNLFYNKQVLDLYTCLSVYSHPTYLEVTHFGQMFNNKEFLDSLLKGVISGCIIVLLFVIIDFSETFECQNALGLLPKEIVEILHKEIDDLRYN